MHMFSFITDPSTSMRVLLLSLLFVLVIIVRGDDADKYRALREQCQRTPSSSDCLQLKKKFLDLIRKCQSITTPQQLVICQEVKVKLCNIFPSACAKASAATTTKLPETTTKRKVTKKKSVATVITTTTTTTTSTTTKRTADVTSSLSDAEFVRVPVDPEELRSRGEYCVRHGKERRCQELLTNLKTTYSTCGKKKPEPKPEQIDCHSFQTHLCKAFPKFPPCLKKTAG